MSDLMIQTMRGKLTKLFNKEPVSLPALKPWDQYLPTLAKCGQDVVMALARPQTANALTLRYIVMDLLDLLAELKIIKKSPLLEYGEFYPSFDIQFQYAWHDLTKALFPKHSRLARTTYLWAKSVYAQRQLDLHYDNLFAGLNLWDIQPTLMLGPSPTTWDMAVPRLMAYSFTDKIWQTAHDPLLMHEVYTVLAEFTTIPLPPAQACNVLLKRIRNLGTKHIENLLYPDTMLTPGINSWSQARNYDAIATARFAWMQTCLYYALIRGKLNRLGLVGQPACVKKSVRLLDTALLHHIHHLTTKDSP